MVEVLEISHGCWFGSYRAFGVWRRQLMDAAGVLDPTEDRHVRYDVADPLTVLLNHSDCDGEIAASLCGPLADRLAGLLPKMPEDRPLGGAPRRTGTFIEGLRRAAAAGQPVVFAVGHDQAG